jgi:membrane-associated phospholipid phosphatase
MRPEIFVYLSLGVFTGAFFLLRFFLPEGSVGATYFDHFGGIDSSRFAWIFAFLFAALLIRAAVLITKFGFQNTDPILILSGIRISHLRLEAKIFLKNVLLIGIPLVLSFWSLSLALGVLNVFNTSRLKDELLFRWDVFLTGTFPPFSLASIAWPAWFVEAVDFSFMKLVPVFMIFAFYVFLVRPRLFREAAGVFALVSMLMFAGWLLFPVLSPHDRFIDNVYDLEIPDAVSQYVVSFIPHENIAEVQDRIRENKNAWSIMPTSTFPSAHIAWAVLFVYYARRLHLWLLAGVVPFALLSSFGTILFAQHYFIDIPAGIAVAVFSIWLVQRLVKK